MRIRLARTPGVLADWKAQWLDLVARSRHPSPIFARPSWLLPWLDVYAGRIDIRVAGAFSGNRLVAFAPLAVDARRGGARLTYLGAPLNDESTILLDAQAPSSVLARLAERIASMRSEWTCLEIPLLDASSAQFPEALFASGLAGSTTAWQRSPAIQLPATMDAYLAALRPAFRERLAYDVRRLDRQHDVGFRIIDDGQEGECAVLALVGERAEVLRATGKERSFAAWTVEPEFGRFLRQVARAAIPCGDARIAELTIDGAAVARALLLVAGSRALIYVRGWQLAFSRFSVGILLDRSIVAWAIGSGLKTLDFGLGAEPYKYDFGAVDVLRPDWRFYGGQ